MGNRPHRDNGEGEEWPSPLPTTRMGLCIRNDSVFIDESSHSVAGRAMIARQPNP